MWLGIGITISGPVLGECFLGEVTFEQIPEERWGRHHRAVWERWYCVWLRRQQWDWKPLRLTCEAQWCFHFRSAIPRILQFLGCFSLKTNHSVYSSSFAFQLVASTPYCPVKCSSSTLFRFLSPSLSVLGSKGRILAHVRQTPYHWVYHPGLFLFTFYRSTLHMEFFLLLSY